MAINGSMIGLASHVLGTSVAGSRSLLGPSTAAPGTTGAAPQPGGGLLGNVFTSALGAADVLLNGSSTPSTTNALSMALVGGVKSVAGTLGITTAFDRIPTDRNATIRLATITAQQSFLDGQIRSAEAAASSGDTSAQTELATLLSRKKTLEGQRLQTLTTGSEQHLTEVRTELLKANPLADGWETYLQPEGRDVLADLASAKTPEARQQMSQRLSVALGVGVAELDTLRAKISYYQHLVETGQVTPEQTAELEALTEQYAGRAEQVEVLRRATASFQRDNEQKLQSLHVEYEQKEQRVGRLVEAQTRLTGRSMVDGRAIDWSALTTEEKQAELHGAAEVVRTANVQLVEEGDASAWEAIEAPRFEEGRWDTYTTEWNLHHEEWDTQRDAFERESREMRDKRDEARLEDRREFDRWIERSSDERRTERRRLDQRASVQQSEHGQVEQHEVKREVVQHVQQRQQQRSDEDFSTFIQSIDQAAAASHARFEQSLQQPAAS